jgi:hypothetical protein
MFEHHLPNTILSDQQVATLSQTADILDAARIRWALWSGVHAAIDGHRQPGDIDAWVHDDDIPLVQQLFPEPEAAHTELDDRILVRIGGENGVECMGRMDIQTAQGTFPLRLTSLAMAHTGLLVVPARPGIQERAYPAANLIDTVLLKAILQRDARVGKHDFLDIASICRAAGADVLRFSGYLEARIYESGCAKRVDQVLAEHAPGIWHPGIARIPRQRQPVRQHSGRLALAAYMPAPVRPVAVPA